LTSAGDLNVTAGGKIAVGPVTTTGDKSNRDQDRWIGRSAGASVTVMRSPAEEAAYQKSLHPGWIRLGWRHKPRLCSDRR